MDADFKLDVVKSQLNDLLEFVKAVNTLYRQYSKTINMGDCIDEIQLKLETFIDKLEDEDY